MNRKIVVHVYNNSCIPQIEICGPALINKDVEYKCNYFAVPGYGLSFLWMPDCECLELLSKNHKMINDLHNTRQINEQTEQEISPNHSIAPIVIHIPTTKLIGK